MLTLSRSARVALGLGAVALAAASLTACSSSSGGSSSSSESASAIGGGVTAPIIVEPGTTSVTAKVGNNIVFNVNDPAKTKTITDKPEVLEITQGKDDGSAVFNPGAKALAAGVATVTITLADGGSTTITVTVE